MCAHSRVCVHVCSSVCRALTPAESQVENAIGLCKGFRPEGWDAGKVLEEVKQKKPADAAKKEKPTKPAGSR